MKSLFDNDRVDQTAAFIAAELKTLIDRHGSHLNSYTPCASRHRSSLCCAR